MLTFALIIPNLNQSHFLVSALESLRYQSVPFNLAVMDGGSTDGFKKVVEDYLDIITCLRSGPDKGQADAIRQGNGFISGDIVAWLNADDYYFPGALDQVASCFENDPELDVVYGNAIHVTDEGFFLSYFPPIQEFDTKDLTRSCFICQPACFVRHSAYEAVGGIDPRLHYTMDWDFWHRLALSGARFKYIPELLAAVRYYPGTKTLSRDWKRYMEIWRIERLYGHRLFPSSWLGSYLYNCRFGGERTVQEKMAIDLFNWLRRIKRRIFKRRESTLYGFHRWEPVAEGCCTIHMPWYGKRNWKKIYLQVEPIDKPYEIVVNDGHKKTALAKAGHILIEAPPLKGPNRKISIECLSKHQWRLLRFSLELG